MWDDALSIGDVLSYVSMVAQDVGLSVGDVLSYGSMVAQDVGLSFGDLGMGMYLHVAANEVDV